VHESGKKWGDVMSLKRFRVGTLMLLVVIAALGTALVVQNNRAARREAELQAQLARTRTELIYGTLVNSADLELSQW
jgi:hypothetical protein